MLENKSKVRLFFILLLSLFFHVMAKAQLLIRSAQLGYGITQMSHMGVGPYSLLHRVKDHDAHQERLKWYEDHAGEGRGMSSAGGYHDLSNLHLNIELSKNNKSRFWRRYTIQTGVFVSNRIIEDAIWMHKIQLLELEKHSKRLEYRFKNFQRFAGVNLGLNRRFPIFKNHFNFILGFYTQVGAALENRYEQKIITYLFQPESYSQSSEQLEDFYGHNYTQWHLTIPLGFEATVNRFSLRTQFYLGYLNDRYRNTLADKEAHGFQFWLGYLLKKPKKK